MNSIDNGEDNNDDDQNVKHKENKNKDKNKKNKDDEKNMINMDKYKEIKMISSTLDPFATSLSRQALVTRGLLVYWNTTYHSLQEVHVSL